jgi:tripartite-type tricarboxylate transporter receptor subunit TctC
MRRATFASLLCVLPGFLTLALPDAPARAQAADWPNKSVRIIVNFGPGGSADNSMRPYVDGLQKAFKQQFVLEHRGGASGALGVEAAVKSPPDGYTFVITPALSVVILPHLRKLPYDPLTDLVPVTQLTDGTLLLAVHPSVPVKSVQELVEWGKKNPGKLSWGTAGVGSYGHIFGETFKIAAGLEILHVPYRGGGEALADFLAGVVQIHADPNTLPHVVSGKANLLAVLDRERLPEFPNVPVVKEIYPELDYLVWFGIYGPKGTPQAIVGKFAAEMNRLAKQPEIKALLKKAALSPNPGTPAELAELTRKDFARFGALIKKLNIKAE